VHWDREFSDALSFDELQHLAHDALHGAHVGSQQERLWIAKLERGDVGKQLEETPQNSARRREVTPSVAGSLAPGTPKRARHVFSLTPEEAASKRKLDCRVEERIQDGSPLRKKQRCRRDSVGVRGTGLAGLFAKSFSEYFAGDSSQSQRSSVPDSQPPAVAADDSTPSIVIAESAPAATAPPSQPPSPPSQPSIPPRAAPPVQTTTIPPVPSASTPLPPPPPHSTTMGSADITPAPTVAISVSTASFPHPPSANKPAMPAAKTASPFPSSTVYVLPHLMTESLVVRLQQHGVSVIDEIRPANARAAKVPVYGAIFLADEWRPRYTSALVEFLEEKKKERPADEKCWQVWEWRAAEIQVGTAGRQWDAWWIWDI